MRIVPNYNKVSLYSLRGIVEGYEVRESGWWIFRERTHVIHVRIKEDQLVVFNDLMYNQMFTPNGDYLPGIAPVIELGMIEKDQGEFPIGAKIGITLGHSRPVDQFCIGVAPLIVMKLQLMAPDVELQNEVVVSA